MRIEVENGAILEFPDDADEMEIEAGVNEYLAGVEAAPQEEPSTNTSLADKIGESYDSRKAEIGKIADQAVSGVYSKPEALVHSGIQGAMMLPDAAGAVMQEGFEMLPQAWQDATKEAVSSGIDTIANINNPFAEGDLGDLANSAIQKYADFEQEHPAAARRLGSIVNVGGIAAPLARGVGGKSLLNRAEGLAEPVVKAAGEGAVAVAKPIAAGAEIALKKLDAARKAGNAPELTADEIKALAQSSYRLADESGGTLKPSITDGFIDKIKAMDKQTAEGAIFAGEDDVSRLVKRISSEENGLAGRSLSLQAAQEIDEELGAMIESNTQLGKVNKAGLKFMQIQDEFRDMIENASPDDLVGGKEGFEALKKGRELWSASLRQADIERILERANQTDNPVTGIKTGFRTLANNPKRMRGYTPEERKLIEQAAKTGVVTGALRLAGSRLIAIGMTGAGIYGLNPAALAGAGAAAAGSAGARRAATALQTRRANKVSNQIQKRVSGNKKLSDKIESPPVVNQPTKLLESPTPETVVSRSGVARVQTPVERDAAIMERQRADSLGLSMDVRSVVGKVERRLKDSSAWEAASQSQKDKIAKEIDSAWASYDAENKPTVAQMIRSAKKRAEDLESATGDKVTGSFADLLEEAIKSPTRKLSDTIESK